LRLGSAPYPKCSRSHAASILLAAGWVTAGCGGGERTGPAEGAPQRAEETAAIRTNQLGYLPQGAKVAVLCSLEPRPEVETFFVLAESGDTAFGPLPAEPAGELGPCEAGFRLDFSALGEEGRYRLAVGSLVSGIVFVNGDVYGGAADTLLHDLTGTTGTSGRRRKKPDRDPP